MLKKNLGKTLGDSADLRVPRTGESAPPAGSSWTALSAAPSAPTSPAPGCQSRSAVCRMSPQTLCNTKGTPT